MEAEESHDMPSACWRPREAGGGIPAQTQMPENQGSCWWKAPSESADVRTGSTDVLKSEGRKRRSSS